MHLLLPRFKPMAQLRRGVTQRVEAQMHPLTKAIPRSIQLWPVNILGNFYFITVLMTTATTHYFSVISNHFCIIPLMDAA
jgi:hypothetical protein